MIFHIPIDVDYTRNKIQIYLKKNNVFVVLCWNITVLAVEQTTQIEIQSIDGQMFASTMYIWLVDSNFVDGWAK